MSKLHPNIKECNKWMLCPSKRLPGQYYYFNIATGEAVWCTSDAKGPENAEKNAAAKHQNTNTQIQEECTRTFSNTNSDTIRIFNRPTNTPTFGKVSFPNYVPIERDKPTTSNTPILDISSSLRTFRNTTPMVSQMPMIVLPLQFMLDPKVSPTSEQVTQISDLETVLLVHSCQMPLSKRFGNYENVVPTTSDEVTSNINPTKPIKTVDSAVGPIVGSTNDIKKSILREPVFNLKNNEVEPKSVNINVEKAKENSHDDNLTLADLNLNDSAGESQQEEEKGDKSVKLQKDDLRLFLIARKRRYTDGDVNPNTSEVKKIKLRRADHVEKPARKHVTFNLDNGVISSPQYSQNIFPDSNSKFSMPILKPSLSTAIKEWYIAVDTNILIENYEFINNLVLTDENCRLLIPESSRRQIESWCFATSFGCRNMFTVRQVASLLKNPPRHVVVGSQTEAKSILFFSDTNMAAYDTLLNCCLEKMNKKHKVVLLSDDEDLLRNAQSLRIQSYKFRYIKESVRKCTDILDLNFKCNDLLNSIDSQPTVSVNKELFAKSHSLFQNITGFNMPAYKNNPFDDQSIDSKMSSHIRPVAQNINFKNNFRANIIQTNEEGHKCQNLFEIQNRDLNSNICSNNPFFFQKSCFDKDVNKGSVKTFQIQNSVPFENQNSNKAFGGNANEIQFQIQNLKSKQVVLPKSNQTTKMEASSSNTPHNNENEDFLENNLKRFEIKNKVMEVRIKERIEEWTCTFRQIMEDALSNVLQISSFQNDLILPWSLLEMIERVNKIYDDATLKIIVNKLIACMAECVCDDVKVKKSVKPQDFVKVIGCGILFMQRLQSIQANCDGLANAKQSLMNLWRTIEDPNEIESVESSHYIHVDIENRQNYVKGPSEIINYLKRHYENWNSYEMSEDQNNMKTNSQNIKIINEIATTTQEDAKIFRTVGKKLRTLRIDSNKSISVVKFQNNPESTFRKVVDNVITKDVTSTKKVSEPPKIDVINKNRDANAKDPKTNENSSKETIVNKVDNKISTKLDTRHVSLVKKIEKGVKAKTALKMDVLNISDIETENNEHTLNIKDGTNFNKNTNDSKYKNDVKSNIDETIRKIGDSGNTKPELSDYGKVMAEINDSSNNKDDNIVKKVITISDSTSDSGIENESYMTYSYIKKFLCELSSILIAIHSFIVENLDELQKIKNDDEKKSNLHKKVTSVRKYLASIIGQLKSIVQRETSGTTLNNLMIEIEEAANDKRISRYRSVIRKFLEQARILQNALKIILCVTENKLEDTYTICSDSTGSSFRYINIFE